MMEKTFRFPKVKLRILSSTYSYIHE